MRIYWDTEHYFWFGRRFPRVFLWEGGGTVQTCHLLITTASHSLVAYLRLSSALGIWAAVISCTWWKATKIRVNTGFLVFIIFLSVYLLSVCCNPFDLAHLPLSLAISQQTSTKQLANKAISQILIVHSIKFMLISIFICYRKNENRRAQRNLHKCQ